MKNTSDMSLKEYHRYLKQQWFENPYSLIEYKEDILNCDEYKRCMEEHNLLNLDTDKIEIPIDLCDGFKYKIMQRCYIKGDVREANLVLVDIPSDFNGDTIFSVCDEVLIPLVNLKGVDIYMPYCKRVKWLKNCTGKHLYMPNCMILDLADVVYSQVDLGINAVSKYNIQDCIIDTLNIENCFRIFSYGIEHSQIGKINSKCLDLYELAIVNSIIGEMYVKSKCLSSIFESTVDMEIDYTAAKSLKLAEYKVLSDEELKQKDLRAKMLYNRVLV